MLFSPTCVTSHVFHLCRGSLASVTAFPRLTLDCHRKIDRGPCSSPIQMWAFDGSRCIPFTYGGCGGNLNRFFTRDECLQTCQKEAASSSTTTTSITRTTTKSTTFPLPVKKSTKFVVKTKAACKKTRVYFNFS
jgi:hypothetical protein